MKKHYNCFSLYAEHESRELQSEDRIVKSHTLEITTENCYLLENFDLYTL